MIRTHVFCTKAKIEGKKVSQKAGQIERGVGDPPPGRRGCPGRHMGRGDDSRRRGSLRINDPNEEFGCKQHKKSDGISSL